LDARAKARPTVEVKRKQVSVRARAVALSIHRYVGLVISAFLLLAGLTGSVIAFYVPLDRALNPELFVVEPPSSGAAVLDPFVLREKLIAQLPASSELNGVVLYREPDSSVNYWVDQRDVFVDPYSGRVLGVRKFGELSLRRQDFLTFLYRLHFSLALGDVGGTLFGVIALLWTLDCFVGAYLTFPPALRQRAAGRAWFVRWLPMWLLNTSKLFSFIFTWHRASGLWLWLVLLVFGWSAVALNLSDYVYKPVMGALFGAMDEPFERLPELKPPMKKPPLPLREAHALGQRLMAAEAKRRNFRLMGERYLVYLPEHGAFSYTVESSLDIDARLAQTTLGFDGAGRVLAFQAPTGQHAASTLTSWIIALHFGAVRELGLAYRIFVCVFGQLVAALSVSGVWIWWKKRRP
jgi:uncharacterized iron-regulated membrane protein